MSVAVSRRVFVRGAAALGAMSLSRCATTIQAAKGRSIGYLNGGSLRTAESEPFRAELRALGYIEGRDINIEVRTGESVPDRLPGLVSDLIGEPVDVLVTVGTLATLAAKEATRTVPIVFHRVTDPVALGIVASLARPGANVTGVAAGTSCPKQLELLKATLPDLRRVTVLWNANNPGAALQLREAEDAARTLQLDVNSFGVHSFDELDTALEAIARSRPGALLVGPAFNHARRPSQIPDFATPLRLPQMYGTDSGFVRAGGLMALGANTASLARSASHLVDKVLRGVSPTELPVELPTRWDFIVNIAASQRIGLVIPDDVLRLATEFVQ